MGTHMRALPSARRPPPACRVRLAVEYRVHSRQMLCVGGSQIPFGWSFLSIAKVPASWNPGDIWAVEVELPAGTKVEYKYVILEEQDWTQQVGAGCGGRAHSMSMERWRWQGRQQRQCLCVAEGGVGRAGCGTFGARCWVLVVPCCCQPLAARNASGAHGPVALRGGQNDGLCSLHGVA